jgi:ribonuclease BN (tRNA processing enzyme)
LVLLGTGNPVPDPEKSGPSVAVVVGDEAYIVDFGPGVVRRAAEAYEKTRLAALQPRNLATAFSTHLHSDHTAGYPDLILTPWVMGRTRPLTVYGPPGIQSMTEHILKAYEADIAMRTHGREANDATGVRVEAVEIEPGVVLRNEHVTVEAISVAHGTWEHAFGYRFETANRVIVISGDTGPSENLVERARGCDVLVHEVYSEQVLQSNPGSWQGYHSTFHTSGVELGKLASEIKPGLLVLYHQLSWSPKELILEEVRRNYDGPLAYGEDLDVY